MSVSQWLLGLPPRVSAFHYCHCYYHALHVLGEFHMYCRVYGMLEDQLETLASASDPEEVPISFHWQDKERTKASPRDLLNNYLLLL